MFMAAKQNSLLVAAFSARRLKNNVFYVYRFECFILARVGELVVKAVCELAYK